MKILSLCYLTVTVLLQVFGATAYQPPLFQTLSTGQVQDSSLLKPTHYAYEDAMKFARFLSDHGLPVRSVHRSKLEGFFHGVEKAAFFRTDKGVIEVVFFPGARGAEKISITYSRNESDVVPHRYKIEGQPTNGSGVIEAAYPMYFTMYKNWYIETSESRLDAILKQAVGQDRRPFSQ